MNLVGKIFVVCVFTMSLVWMAFTLMVRATHKNWKDEIERTAVKTPGQQLGLKLQLKNTTDERNRYRAQLEDAKARLADVNAATSQALAQLQTSLTARQQELDQSVAQNQALSTKSLADTASLKASQDNLVAMNKEVETLRQTLATSQVSRDVEFQKVLALTDTLHQRLGDLNRLQERRDELVRQLAQYDLVMKKLGISNVALVATDGVPRVNGNVTAVSRKGDLVEISIGSDDGLKSGHTLDITRQNKYLGKIEIVKTTPDKSVARVLKQYLRGEIRKGDNVYSNTRTAT